MEIKIYRSITEIEKKEWDSIAGRDRIICTHEYLKAVEKANLFNSSFFYPIVFEGRKIIAHACIYTINFQVDLFARGMIKKIINFIRKFFPDFLVLKFMECGTPISVGQTISFAENINRKQALYLIIAAMENICAKEKCGLFILRDFYENELDFFSFLKELGFKIIPNYPNALFEVRWRSFEEYLDGLRYNYRRNIKRKLKKIKDNGLLIEITDNYARLSDELVRLWENCFLRAREYRREILTADFFRYMNEYLPGKTKVIIIWKDRDILGYGLILDDDITVRALFIGIDYEYNESCATYFNIWYSLFDYAMKHGKKYIDMGITTYEPKISLGAKILPLYVYMRHDNRLMNLIYEKLFKLMMPVTRQIPRYIFKKQKFPCAETRLE